MTASGDGQTVGAPIAGRAGQTARRDTRLTAALWAVTLLAALAGLALTVVTWGDLKLSDGIASLFTPVAAVAYATLGALIIRRAANLIGWIMLAEGAAQALIGLTSLYAIVGVAHPGLLPAAKLAGTLSECVFSPVTFLIAFMFLLFPTGKLPSPRWRPVAAAGLLLAGLTLAGLIVTPRLLQLPAPGGISVIYSNPLGVESLEPVLRAVLVGTLNGLSVVFVAFMAAVLVSLAVRYRAGDPAAVRQLAPAVKDGLRAALEDLRDLARGIYPPLLADQGLLPALQAQAHKAPLPVEIDADGVGRYPQDTEAAVYFCTLEALQNVTKYAGASRATVGLLLRQQPPVHRHRRRDRVRHRQHPQWHRPAGDGRPAGRARRRPPRPLTPRARNHPERPAPGSRTWSDTPGF
jgi:hypothetical protein